MHFIYWCIAAGICFIATRRIYTHTSNCKMLDGSKFSISSSCFMLPSACACIYGCLRFIYNSSSARECENLGGELKNCALAGGARTRDSLWPIEGRSRSACAISHLQAPCAAYCFLGALWRCSLL
jgi:hypothetical protein